VTTPAVARFEIGPLVGQALLASLQKFLRPAVIKGLDDCFRAAQLGDAVLAAQTSQDNANFLLR
jgi:hypothetical protein